MAHSTPPEGNWPGLLLVSNPWEAKGVNHMPEDKCAKCGAALPEGALICHHCKALTPAGIRARGLGADNEDEAWVQSVREAQARHAHRPSVDADEVLRKVVTQTGTEDQILRLTRQEIAFDDRRTEYSAVRTTGQGLLKIGTVLAALLATGGLLLLVGAILQENAGGSAIPVGLGLAILMLAAAMAVYFVFRFMADAVVVFADLGDNSRRLVLLLRAVQEALQKQEATSGD